MSFDINIMSNVYAMEDFLDDFKTKVVTQATRSAINKAIKSTRTEAVKIIRLRLNISASDLKKKHIRHENAKATYLKGLYGEITFSALPMPLIDFVTGKHSKTSQKGIPIKKRRPIKVKVLKGKAVKLKKAFITKVRSTQVFKRGSSGFYKQGVPSVGEWVKREYIYKPIKIHARQSFDKNFRHEYAFRLEKAIAKTNRQPLK